jgi:hypothetical protein
LAERLPASFKPPLGFFPALRCHAGVLMTTGSQSTYSQVGPCTYLIQSRQS